MGSKKKSFSLSDLDATKASESAYEFQYLLPGGEGTGIYFSVLGSETETVTKEVARLVNERRKKEAIRNMNQNFRNKNNAEFEPLESDIEFGQRLAAIRLVGWRGIQEEFNAENALKLCQSNRDIAAQITQNSDNLANFMKL